MKRLIFILIIILIIGFPISCHKTLIYDEKVSLIQSGVINVGWKHSELLRPGFIKYWGYNEKDQPEIKQIVGFLVEAEETLCIFKPRYELVFLFKNGRTESISFLLMGKTFIGEIGEKCVVSLPLGELLWKYLPQPSSTDFPSYYKHLEEMKKIKESTERELLILYRENADANEIRQLKEEWWDKIELEFKKYPKAYPDLNEVRCFKEDWWGKIEEDAKHSWENPDKNQP